MMRLRHALAGLLAVAVGLVAPAARAADESTDRLADEVARHPEDRDLSWALARTLAERGRLEAAAARLAEHLRRWPGHPSDGWVVLGRWRSELGEDEAAVAAFEQALARDPEDGATHLLLGLARKRLGQSAAAEKDFARAARFAPELAGEALLLGGLTRFDRGDAAGGERLLERLIAEHPRSDAAQSAHLVLHGLSRSGEGRFRLEAYSGIAFDSNVTLEGGGDFPGAGNADADGRVAWGASGTFRALRGERSDLELGARVDGSTHFDLRAYDTQRSLGFFSARHQPTRRVGLRLDGWLGFTLLDYEPYLLEAALRPTLMVSLGERAGALRAFAEASRLSFHEKPFSSALERDGWAFGGGLEHYAFVPGLAGSEGERGWLSVGTGYTRRETEARRDMLGFDGAYDHHRVRGSLRGRLPLPWQLRAETELTFDAELYDAENVIDALTRDGVGTADPRKRSDLVWNAGVTLARPVTPVVDLELFWRYTNRDSNVDLYTYDRSIAGLAVRVHTP